MSKVSNKLTRSSWYSPRLVLVLLAIIVWSFFLWRAVNVFKPGVNSVVPFNSDCAIPVLMSNDERPITPFNLYYYGHDRWGGWPFLFVQLVRRATGYHWTPQRLAALQIFWLFLGALVIAGLSRRHWAILAVTFLLSVCVFDSGHQIFLLSHVFAWQVTALLLAWYSLRRVFDRDAEAENQRRWKSRIWPVVLFATSYLAIWSSITSVPFLLLLVCLETLRRRLRADHPAHDPKLLKSFLAGLVPVLAATVTERLQVMFFRRAVASRFGVDYHTPMELDYGFLIQNLKIQLDKFVNVFWWPFGLIASVAIVTVGVMLIYGSLKKNDNWLLRVKAITASNTATVALGAYVLALINFVLAVAVRHVRINDYDDRYLVLTNLFSTISGLLILFLIVYEVAGHRRVRQYIQPALAAGGAVLMAVTFPTAIHRPEYQAFADAAGWLAQKSPRGILLGDYWGTYVFASLQPVNTMTPVPFEGQFNRMPWTREMMRTANELVLQYPGIKLEESAQPPERLSQYGARFSVVEPRWYDNGVFAFARYVRNDAAEPDTNAVGDDSDARRLYLHILSREPNQVELKKFATQIKDCRAEDICIQERTIGENLNLLHSVEFQTGGGFVFQLYKLGFGRVPKYLEWERDRKKLAALGQNAAAFIDDWAGQAEFVSRYPSSLSNGEYIDKLLEATGSSRDETQRAALLERLNDGRASRAATLKDLISRSRPAAEDNEAFVTLCYFIYLKRDPDPGGFTHWLRTLRDRPKGEEVVVDGFLKSGEYRSKFPRL